MQRGACVFELHAGVGPGNDTLVVHFNSAGGSPTSPETLSGGPGFDTLLIQGTDGNDLIKLTQTVPGSVTYSATLGGDSSGTAAFTLPALAFAIARHTVHNIQPDLDVLVAGRPKYATSPESLIAASQVVAIEFQTIAAANGYWRP